MIRCPICQQSLGPTARSPYAPICSDACRREAMRRAGYAEPPPAPSGDERAQFDELRATHLYCATCRGSMPTTERLLLTLPDGELFGYFCAQCGSDVGTRTARG